jgi:AAA domain
VLFSGEEPDSLRGPQAEFVVIDEIARMRCQEHVFDMAMHGRRFVVIAAARDVAGFLFCLLLLRSHVIELRFVQHELDSVIPPKIVALVEDRAGGGGHRHRVSHVGAVYGKMEWNDYRNATIAKALKNVRPKAKDRKIKLLDPQNGRITISTAPPAPRDYALEGLLLPDKSAVLAGFAGVSKTQLALHFVTALALGQPFMGRATKPGNVIVILGEEDPPRSTAG